MGKQAASSTLSQGDESRPLGFCQAAVLVCRRTRSVPFLALPLVQVFETIREPSMNANPWRKWFGPQQVASKRIPARLARRTRLHLEQLESRCVPTLLTLASFNNSNGAYPYAGVTEDIYGNLFGTTHGGGRPTSARC